MTLIEQDLRHRRTRQTIVAAGVLLSVLLAAYFYTQVVRGASYQVGGSLEIAETPIR